MKYLNGATSPSQWVAMIQEAPYLLLGAPEPLCCLCVEWLKTNGVDHTYLPGPRIRAHPKAKRAIWLDSSWVICQEAHAEVEGM